MDGPMYCDLPNVDDLEVAAAAAAAALDVLAPGNESGSSEESSSNSAEESSSSSEDEEEKEEEEEVGCDCSGTYFLFNYHCANLACCAAILASVCCV